MLKITYVHVLLAAFPISWPCIFCCCLKSHLFSLSYPAFWLFCYLCSAHAATRHLGHYNRYNSPKVIHPIPGHTEKFGVGKVACWSTKATISLKRAKIEEKLLWRTCRNSPTLFRTVPSPTRYSLLFPKIGVRNPIQKFSRYYFRNG